ncbi:MAG: Rap1a/Tai family immunity protein [Burkholderiaceae bacterium]|nr:Rap1a/Tai family immunity protein [Burkholderiaceae bacterium]
MKALFRSLALFSAILLAGMSCLAAVEDDIQIRDGNALLSVCGNFVNALDRGTRLSEKDVVTLAACTSYLRGFTHGVALLSREPQQGAGYCIDESIPSAQVARVLVKYLRENPKNLHLHPAVLTVQALREGFPCK